MSTPKSPKHLLDYTLDEFTEACASRGLPRFRAKQVFEWVFEKRVASFEAMTNLSKELRRQFAEEFVILTSELVRQQDSKDGTTKMLLAWPDGATSECVRIPDGQRNTGCISSQVGCPVGCTFCASGMLGLDRQLTAGQIVEQVWRIQELCETPTGLPADEEQGDDEPSDDAPFDDEDLDDYDVTVVPPTEGLASFLENEDEPAEEDDEEDSAHPLTQSSSTSELKKVAAGRLTNLVFMGLGEPLANFPAVTKALQIINSKWGMNLGARRITVSTIGLPKQIRKLAKLNLQINLAISLHAPNDALRRQLIPWAEKITIDELIDAGRYYFDATGREITLEYVLLGGVNDRLEQANDLVRVCRKMRCNVNLLRYNPVPSLPFLRPSSSDAFHFVQRLRERGVNVHVRTSRGMDIDAACGQLRRRHQGRDAKLVTLKPKQSS